MATETLRPNAAGSLNDIRFQFPDSTFHWDKVDEAVADEDTTYVHDTLGLGDLYALPAFSGAGTINKITVYVRGKQQGGLGNVQVITRTHSTNYYGFFKTLSSAAYETISQEYVNNPNTGSPWIPAEVDDLQIGCMLNCGGGQWLRATQVYVVVDFTPITAPTVATVAADNVKQVTANPKGNVTATGGENPTRFIDYDIDSGAPYANSENCGVGGTGVYSSNLTGLIAGTKYYYRARAVNSGGTGTGAEMTFTTLSVAARHAQMSAKMVEAGLI